LKLIHNKFENFISEISFLFVWYQLYEKSWYCTKSIIFVLFKLENFFCSSNIEKIKTLLHSQSSTFYVVNISFLNYDCSLIGSSLRKTGVFYFMFNYICKTETTHAGIASCKDFKPFCKLNIFIILLDR